MTIPCIFLGISHGFQVRNFFETPFIRGLAESYHVVVFVSDLDKHHLERFLVRLGLGNIEVIGIRILERKFENLFLFLRKNIFVSPKRVQSKNILNEMNNASLGSWQFFFSGLNLAFGTSEFSRAIWRNVEGMFIRGKEFDSFFERFAPARVVTADYGTRPLEIRLLRAARRYGVMSIAVVPSWDNLTSKGVMGVKPDYLTVWNDIMLNEAVELHSFAERRIAVTGPLQFDNFFTARNRMSRESFERKFNIRPDQPVIVYGTISPRYFRYNIPILNILKEIIEDGRVKKRPKVIVRLHPQVVSDPVHGDNLEDYKDLVRRSDTFSLSIPAVEDWGSLQVPLETDFDELISILGYAGICIAPASTLIFDSFACHTCFIGVGFDGCEKEVPLSKSVRRMFEFEHYKSVLEIGGFSIAESRDELVRLINAYFDDPTIHQREREITLNKHIKFQDGLNYQRVLEAIDNAR
jgi:hypothetical protein